MKTSTRFCSALLALSIVLPAFAMEGEGEGGTTTTRTAKTVDIACMQTAVVKREDAVIAAFNAFNAAGSAALTARRDALSAAWGNSDAAARKAAIKAAWQAYKTAAKGTRQTLRQARKAAWQQFKTDAKACKGSVAEESQGGGSEGADQKDL